MRSGRSGHAVSPLIGFGWCPSRRRRKVASGSLDSKCPRDAALALLPRMDRKLLAPPHLSCTAPPLLCYPSRIVLAGPYALDRRHIRCFVVTSVCAFQCLRALSSCFVPAARRVVLSHGSNAILPACPLIPLLLSIPAPRRVVLLSNGRGSSPSTLPLLIISRLPQGHDNFISRRPLVTSRRLLISVRHISTYGPRMSARH